MADETVHLQFFIHLSDKGAYDHYVKEFHTTAVAGPVPHAPGTPGAWISPGFMSPIGWCSIVSAEIVFINQTAPPAKPPCLKSPYFKLGTASQGSYPLDKAVFKRKSGGWFGISWLFGDETTYKWIGQFKYDGTEENTSETGGTTPPMPKRTWVDGFEQGASAAAVGNQGDQHSPLASRHQGGYGFAARNGGSLHIQHSHTESGHAVTTKGWERFYVRLRNAPNSNQSFWEMVGAISSGQGGKLRFTSAGAIDAISGDNTTFASAGTSAPLVLNRWYKLDVLYQYSSTDGFFRAFLGGVQFASIAAGSVALGTGIAVNQNHQGSKLSDGHGSGHRGAWDFDDWVGGELPWTGSAPPSVMAARDWNTGSKVVPLRAQAAAASNGSVWAGPAGANPNDWRMLMQRPGTSTAAGAGLTTSAASPRAAVITDAQHMIDVDPLNRGVAAVTVGAASFKTVGAAADCKVGLSAAGGAEVQKTVTTESNGGTAGQRAAALIYEGGVAEPLTPTKGTEISFTGNTTAASAKTLYNIIGQAECLGNFYPEDYVPQAGDPAGMIDGFPPHWTNDLHWHAYPLSIYAKPDEAPMSILVNHGGTYVGNGTSQLLAFRTPPTWIVIRNVTTHANTVWFVAGTGAHTGWSEATRSQLLPRVYLDPNFVPADVEDAQQEQAIVVVTGNDPASNAPGVTYNYMVVQDAGSRFMESGGLWEHAASSVERQTLLNSPTRTPEYLMLHRETGGVSGTKTLFVKGLGLATQTLSQCLNPSPVVNALEMRTGLLATPPSSPLYAAPVPQIAFVAMWRDDGSGDPGVKNVMQLASWTGDGSASRTVSLGPPTGRRPMWAMVIGSNGVTRFRDPSHTSTSSTNWASDTNDATTGIVGGGIDSIAVSSVLNTNAVLYEAFVIPGCDATAGNTGWGINCESIPVKPITPRPPWRPPPTPPPPPSGPGPGEPGVPTIPPTGTITQCPGPSALVINMALGKIGIAKQVDPATLNTAIGAEITAARLHFDEDVKRILRDFPWPFATRYEVLTQTAGPANESKRVQAYSSTALYAVNDVVRDPATGIDYYVHTAAPVGVGLGDANYFTLEIPEEVNGDWTYAYRAPALSLFNRRVVNNTMKSRRTWDMDPPDFRVGSDANGPLIYSNELNAELEYTILDGCVANQGDALFREALAWRHACSIAPALTRSKDVAQVCWEMYQRLLRDARGSGAQEQQQAPQGDPDWITGRQ